MAFHVRSRARGWALSLLYGWEIAGEGTALDFARRALERRRMSRRYRPYVERLLRTVDEHREEIDRLIGEHASNWRLERIGAIDRNVLRLGIAELVWADDVPPKVAIHEAVKLATKYGGAESPRFVNGVLDGVYRKVVEEGRDGGADPEADAGASGAGPEG